MASTGVNLLGLQSLIRQLRPAIGEIRLSEQIKTELASDLGKLEAEMATAAASPDLIRHHLVTVRYMLETAPADARAAAFAIQVINLLGK